MSFTIRQLTDDDIAPMEALLAAFGEAFNDVDSYIGNRPSPGYLRRLLGGDSFIALIAEKNGTVVGGIAGAPGPRATAVPKRTRTPNMRQT